MLKLKLAKWDGIDEDGEDKEDKDSPVEDGEDDDF